MPGEETDIRNKIGRLSPRQVECLRYVYERRTSKEIATDIGLSSTTVDSYITEAVATLDARNRRHAAELLHAAAPPQKLGSQFSRDQNVSVPAQKVRRRPFRLTEWVPVRQPGATGNDLSLATRLLIIPVLAVLLAIGFGMLSNGARVVSDLLAIWLR